MWNNVFRPVTTDDYDPSFLRLRQRLLAAENKSLNVIQYYQIGHYAGYDLVGRTEVDPMPIDPDFKKTNRLWVFGLYPVLAPQSRARRWIHPFFAMRTPIVGDDQWSWTHGFAQSQAYRLKQSPANCDQRRKTWNPDHYSGFNAKTEEYKLSLPRREGDARRYPWRSIQPESANAPTDGGASACPEAWENAPRVHRRSPLREPRRASARAAVQDRRVHGCRGRGFEPYIERIRISAETSGTTTSWVDDLSRPAGSGRQGRHLPFQAVNSKSARVSTDVQSGLLATMCYLPRPEHSRARGAGTSNMGAVDKSFFTTEIDGNGRLRKEELVTR